MSGTPQSYAEKLRSTSSIDIHTPPPDHPANNKGGSKLPPVPLPPSFSSHKQKPEFPGKRTWSNVRFGMRLLGLLCSIATGVTMALVVVAWQKRKDAWPENPQAAPTYYMLAAAGVSLPFHFFFLIKHFTSRPENLTEAYSTLDRISTVIQLWLGITWLVGGILTRAYASKRQVDLWSWSCSISRPESTVVMGIESWKVHWPTVCIFFKVGYTAGYVNAMLEYLSVLSYSIHGCVAKRNGYKPAPVNEPV